MSNVRLHVVVWRGVRYTFTAPLAAIRFLARMAGHGQGVTIRQRGGETVYGVRKGGR